MNDLFSHNIIRDILRKLKEVPSESLESETIEFKEYNNENALHNAKDLSQGVSALANKSGGDIIVGVRDSSKVTDGNWSSQLVGFEKIDLLEARERIAGKVKPNIELSLNQIVFEGNVYLAINVPHRRDTLVTTSSGKVYIRDGRSSRPMSPQEIGGRQWADNGASP